MRPTWKDAAATAIVSGVVALYIAFLSGAGLPLVSSARAMGLAVLVLGLIACAVGGTALPTDKNPWTNLLSFFGTIAFLTAVLVMILGSEMLLAVLVGTTVALWLAASLRHSFGAQPAPDKAPEREPIHR
jgi:hypothetical protein